MGDAEAAASAAPIKKNFWRECAELQAMDAAVRGTAAGGWRIHLTCSPQEVAALRERLNIEVKGETAQLCFKPVRSFAEASFPDNVLAACRHVPAGS